jgi:hypothetical protein
MAYQNKAQTSLRAPKNAFGVRVACHRFVSVFQLLGSDAFFLLPGRTQGEFEWRYWLKMRP